jgi:hypothetical protein
MPRRLLQVFFSRIFQFFPNFSIPPSFSEILRILRACRGDAINVDQRLSAGVFDIVDRVGRYVGYFALPNRKAFVFADQQFALAGKKNERFLVSGGAVLAAGLAGLQIDSAAAHSTRLRLAIQELLVFGALV